MIDCSGCRRQQPGTDSLCLACIEDLNAWLREIPALYGELHAVRLPGSVRTAGPQTGRLSGSAPQAPVRLEVLDLLDRGEAFRKLEVWAGPGGDVTDMCDRLRHNLLSVPLWTQQDAGDFYRAIKALCRDLGRTVGEPQDQSVGKCAQPDSEGFLCRGPLFRSTIGMGVICRRCGNKPELKEQEVWVTLQQAATVTGVPIETVRTWYKRGRVGWSPPLAPGLCWLPIVTRRAAESRTTTLQHSSGSVNHGSGAELSPVCGDLKSSRDSVDDQGHVTQSAELADRSDRGTPDPSSTAPSRGGQVRAGEEASSRDPLRPGDASLTTSNGALTGADSGNGVVQTCTTEDESRSVEAVGQVVRLDPGAP